MTPQLHALITKQVGDFLTSFYDHAEPLNNSQEEEIQELSQFIFLIADEYYTHGRYDERHAKNSNA